MIMKKKPTNVTPADGNVFEDLGFPKKEAANLKLRAELMIKIEEEIKRRKLTQVKAAKLINVTQNQVSDLVNGHIGRFSVDKLVNMLVALDVEVTITTKRRRKKAA